MSFQDIYQAKLEDFIDRNLGLASKESLDTDTNALRSQFRKQSKIISQLIAESWLKTDRGKYIKEILLGGNTRKIKQLLKDNGIDIDQFLGRTIINVDWDTFFGTIKEVSHTSHEIVYNMPYPPRPSEVSDEELQDWVDNTDPQQVYPTAPYIPLSGF